MAKHAYHDHLKRIPIFRGLSDDEYDVLAHAATWLDYEPGKVLMRQGELAHEMFIVVEGTLEVTRDDEHVAEIGPGGFAGEIALITQGHRNSTVVAKTNASVLHVDGREFESVLETAPQIAVKMLPTLAERIHGQSGDHAD